jgi:predicted GIY-YIG superfamily endonuclease
MCCYRNQSLSGLRGRTDGGGVSYPGPADARVGTVYLLHFSGRTAAGRQHYLGWTTDLAKRLARHQAGRGAAQTRKAVEEGLKLKLAQAWRGTPGDERRIKEERRRVEESFACLCPYCEAEDEAAADLVRGMGPPQLRVLRLPAGRSTHLEA